MCLNIFYTTSGPRPLYRPPGSAFGDKLRQWQRRRIPIEAIGSHWRMHQLESTRDCITLSPLCWAFHTKSIPAYQKTYLVFTRNPCKYFNWSYDDDYLDFVYNHWFDYLDRLNDNLDFVFDCQLATWLFGLIEWLFWMLMIIYYFWSDYDIWCLFYVFLINKMHFSTKWEEQYWTNKMIMCILQMIIIWRHDCLNCVDGYLTDSIIIWTIP